MLERAEWDGFASEPDMAARKYSNIYRGSMLFLFILTEERKWKLASL